MALMFVPLRKLTSRRAAAAVVAAPAAAESSLHLEITATSGPFQFVVKHLGNVIWKGDAGTAPVSENVKMDFPPEGVDLVLQGKFKDPSEPGAVKLAVTPENGSKLERVVWASGPVDEVLTFQP